MTVSRPLTLLAAATLAALALAGCSGFRPPVPVGGSEDPPTGETDAFAIVVGDCLNDAAISEEVTTLPLVDCAEPHDSEVFARTDSTAAEFPGSDQLSDELDRYCTGEAFTAFVGIPYADSIYETGGYIPTEGSWANGDRELLCTIWDPEGRVTGSLAGIAR